MGNSRARSGTVPLSLEHPPGRRKDTASILEGGRDKEDDRSGENA
jgi:hypothetical protein